MKEEKRVTPVGAPVEPDEDKALNPDVKGVPAKAVGPDVNNDKDKGAVVIKDGNSYAPGYVPPVVDKDGHPVDPNKEEER